MPQAPAPGWAPQATEAAGKWMLTVGAPRWGFPPGGPREPCPEALSNPCPATPVDAGDRGAQGGGEGRGQKGRPRTRVRGCGAALALVSRLLCWRAPVTSLSTRFLRQVDNSPSVPGEKTHPWA